MQDLRLIGLVIGTCDAKTVIPILSIARTEFSMINRLIIVWSTIWTSVEPYLISFLYLLPMPQHIRCNNRGTAYEQTYSNADR